MQSISFLVSLRFEVFLRPLIWIVTDLYPDFPRIVTRFVFICCLPCTISEWVCSEVYNIYLMLLKKTGSCLLFFLFSYFLIFYIVCCAIRICY